MGGRARARQIKQGGGSRTRSESGVYTTCSRCRGRGYQVSKGVRLYCVPCAGDGLVRVGSKSTGHGRGRRRTKRSGRRRRRAAGTVVQVATVWFGLGQLFGTVGYVLAAVLIVLGVGVKVLGVVARAAS